MIKKKIQYAVVSIITLVALCGCGNSKIPPGMDNDTYEIACKAIDVVEDFQKGEKDSLDYIAAIKGLESDLSSKNYKSGTDEFESAVEIIYALVPLENAPYDMFDDFLANKEYLMSRMGLEITDDYSNVVPISKVPPHWLDNYKYGRYRLYDSHADENGLQGDQIWIEGEVESSFINENPQTGETEYCSLIKIGKMSNAEDENWMVIYTEDLLPTLDIDAIQNQKVCMIGEYLGYTDELQAPVLSVKGFFIEE